MFVGSGMKMYVGRREAREWMEHVVANMPKLEHVNLFVLPPFVWLPDAMELLASSPVGWGAQNMHWDDKGAWTGEISPLMLKELAVTYVEIGHSERREHFNETDETVNRKVKAALNHGFRPIVCIGELERDPALAEEVLTEQMAALFRDVPAERWPDVIVAYEPVWAIGQDNPADIPYLSNRFAQLRAWITEANAPYGKDVPILYGGSVNLPTTAELLTLPEMGGLFIGRAALDPAVFCKIASITDQWVSERQVR